MKGVKFFMIGLIVLIILVGGYFAANIYMQNRAVKRIDKILKENNLQNDFSYESLSANIFSRAITLHNAELTLRDRIKNRELGYLKIKTLIVSGNFNKHYNLKAYTISFISEKIRLSKGNEPILRAEYADFNTYKKEGITTKMVGEIKGIRITKAAIQSIKGKNGKVIKSIVELNNPINVYMNFLSDPDRETVDIKYYKIEFINNLGFSYGMKLENVDIKGLHKLAKEMQANPKNFALIGILFQKLGSIKPLQINISLTNYGLIDRALSYIAKEDNKTKESIVDNILKEAKKIPSNSAYPAIKNFLLSKKKTLSVLIKNKEKLDVATLFGRLKDKQNLNQLLEIQFSN